MVARRNATLFACIATALLMACADDAGSPTGAANRTAAAQPHSMDHMSMAITDASTVPLDPFTFRATIDPYRIQQLPDFMIHSSARTDIVFQRSVFAPGAGPWHTHPGPSFIYVIDGQIKLQRHSKKDGCTETQVYNPGSAYFEQADEVHRAVVVSSTSAVVMVTRFNVPVGGAFTIPAADPGC